jgi:hypothetical protein
VTRERCAVPRRGAISDLGTDRAQKGDDLSHETDGEASMKEEAMTETPITVKSGKGIRDGVVSELTVFFGVEPGHEEQLRAACQRFTDGLHAAGPESHLKTIEARTEWLAAATGADAERLLGWCAAFAGMTALELASQGDRHRLRTEALRRLAERAPKD